jgi:hypothetical protein
MILLRKINVSPGVDRVWTSPILAFGLFVLAALSVRAAFAALTALPILLLATLLATG